MNDSSICCIRLDTLRKGLQVHISYSLVLFNDFFSRYPTSEMYEDTVDGLIREYPYLLNYGDLPASSARVSGIV